MGEVFNMDTNEIVTSHLRSRFSEIKRRMLSVINQLSDEDLHWRPNEESNSIANLVIHIAGVIHQRIESGIGGAPDTRDRDSEFESTMEYSRSDLTEMIDQSFHLLDEVITNLKPVDFLKQQTVRNNQVTVLDVIMQCASHLSEHLGQIMYIGKLRLCERYVTTTIPRRKNT
jgi:uncharacterized damage-inducible protein DinB